MSDIHITRWLLRSARDGFVPLPLLVEIVAEHFQNLCPVCRREMEAFLEGDAEQELDDDGYHAALVNLDLALLFIESGERSRVRELAREIAPIFEAEGVHEEALAALVLFREAALDDSASQDFVRRLIVYLRQGRNDPERPFLEADA